MLFGLFCAVFLGPAVAPALDWVDKDLQVQHSAVYRRAVESFAANAVCFPPRQRHTAQHRDPLQAAGQPLVLPLHERRVTIAASYEWHFLYASRLAWGGSDRLYTELPPDLLCTVDATLTAASQRSLALQRRANGSRWRATCESLRPFSAAIVQRHLLPYGRRIAADANVACLAASVDALQYRDRDLARQTVMGCDLARCHLPDSRVYRPVAVTADQTAACEAQLATMADPARAAARSTALAERTLKAALRDPEAAAAVRATTAKELGRGLIDGPFASVGELRRALARGTRRSPSPAPWPLSRFARWQGEEKGYRAIDDGKEAGTNLATVLHETIVCPSFSFPWLKTCF